MTDPMRDALERIANLGYTTPGTEHFALGKACGIAREALASAQQADHIGNGGFVVIGKQDQEGSQQLKSFQLRAAAEAFSAACYEHKRSKPEFPPVESTIENDLLWVEYEEAYYQWDIAAPAGSGNADFDAFEVIEAPFHSYPDSSVFTNSKVRFST